MKLHKLFSASFLAVFAILSATAYADDKPADLKADKPVQAQAAKPHSHVQEKTGAPQNVPAATPLKKDAAKDKSKHYHPRDK